MVTYFHKELNKMKKKILSLGTMVEDRFRMAVRAIDLKDLETAQKIIATDFEIDEMEVEVEEECLKILALHQPVAVDLRFLVAVIKINNDLERIADQAVNIAERVARLAREKNPAFSYDYSMMAQRAGEMLKKSLDALVNLDADLARKVMKMDDEVDQLAGEVYDLIKKAIQNHPEQVGYLINLFLISRHLERIADHATNIAEEVIHLIEGEIIRHEGETACHMLLTSR
ncbi:MAG: phosphate signaling complex protein PhoU [Desulfuromonadales bacterium]|nr:phosphate signaling complex protein PhoU [Desulfuromonadales bacterium]